MLRKSLAALAVAVSFAVAAPVAAAEPPAGVTLPDEALGHVFPTVKSGSLIIARE